MLRCVTVRQRAHAILVWVPHAAVQVRSMHSRAQAATATSTALSVFTALRSGNHTGHMQAAERTSHASCDATERMQLLPLPLLAPSAPMTLSSPRRSGCGAARHAWPWQRRLTASAVHSKPLLFAHPSVLQRCCTSLLPSGIIHALCVAFTSLASAR